MRRRILSQNFLHSPKLVKKLVGKSSIGGNDTVVEIGPGTGIITEELLKVSKNVIGIEIDSSLCTYLLNKFKSYKLQLVHTDILNYRLPNFSYKVFANIPFSIEGKIIRKLLTAANPPEDSYLVMRKDLAERLSGIKQECQFSIFYKPWFTFEIIHHFNRYDFASHAKMNCVLLRFTKRKMPLLKTDEKKRYMMFVGQGFGG